MEKNYSYAEFMKVVGKNSSSIQAEKLLSEIYMDLFFKCIHREQIRARLLQMIDDALDRQDEKKFLLYSEQLIQFDNVK